jgi:hypothetical protein
MMMSRLLLYSVFLTILSIGLTGCGIRPSSLEPPSGDAAGQFPRTYPAPVDEKN